MARQGVTADIRSLAGRGRTNANGQRVSGQELVDRLLVLAHEPRLRDPVLIIAVHDLDGVSRELRSVAVGQPHAEGGASTLGVLR